MTDIYLVRHGEASHNKAVNDGGDKNCVYKDSRHFDAELTPMGIDQAKTLAVKCENAGFFSKYQNIFLVSSCLSRAIHTLFYGFFSLPCTSKRILLTDLCRERAGGQRPCDSRPSLSAVRKMAIALFGEEVNCEGEEADDVGSCSERESLTQVEERCFRFLYFLNAIDDRKSAFVVVSHSAFLRHFLAVLHIFRPEERKLGNCDVRKVELDLSAENVKRLRGLADQRISETFRRSVLEAVEQWKRDKGTVSELSSGVLQFVAPLITIYCHNEDVVASRFATSLLEVLPEATDGRAGYFAGVFSHTTLFQRQICFYLFSEDLLFLGISRGIWIVLASNQN